MIKYFSTSSRLIRKFSVGVLITSFFLSAFSAYGQQSVVQPEHPKQVHVDVDKAHIYVWKTGLYLYVGTEEGDQTKRYQMINKSSSGQLTVEPFYLDEEGLNTIIEPNPRNRTLAKDALSEFRIYADWSAPKSSISDNGQSPYVFEKRTIYAQPFDFSIVGKEKKNGSGVDKSHFSINNEDFQAISVSHSITDEGTYKVLYYTVDRVGNVEKVKTQLYGLDMTAPTSTYQILGKKVENILSIRTYLNLFSTDNLAGTKSTYYSFDEADKKEYRKSVSLATITEGLHDFHYYSVDHVDNTEENATYSFYLDRTPPEVGVSIEGSQHNDGKTTFIAANSTLKLSATDNKVGVEDIYYTLNKKSTLIYSDAISPEQSKTNHALTYWAMDELENVSKKTTDNYVLDVEAPFVSYSFTGKHFESRDINYIHQNTVLKLNATDDLSQVQQINYTSVNETAAMAPADQSADAMPAPAGEQTGDSVFFTEPSSLYNVSYSAMDNVDNKSEQKNIKVFVDSELPTLSYEFGVTNITGETVKVDAATKTFPEKVILFLFGSDNDSGVAYIQYSINGAPHKYYANPIPLDQSNEYSVEVIVSDNVGNQHTEVVNFTVSNN